MTIIRHVDQFNVDDLYLDLSDHGLDVMLKCEGMNFAGSIKLKAAVRMLDAAETAGVLVPGSIVVESSSGNLGIALAMSCASRGYRLHIVTDVRCSTAGIQIMRAYGASVEVIDTPHPEGGLLGARLERIQQVLRSEPLAVWLDQYTNENNWQAHYHQTGPEILGALGTVDEVFVGVGTSGTAMGIARFMRRHSPRTRVIGIDVHGSVSFGGPAAVRHIPGLGAGVRPPLLEPSELHAVMMVSEQETVDTCRWMLRRGLLLGGSTGSTLAGARRWILENPHSRGTRVVIAPDLGDRYLSTVYEASWVEERFGLASDVVPDETLHHPPTALSL